MENEWGLGNVAQPRNIDAPLGGPLRTRTSFSDWGSSDDRLWSTSKGVGVPSGGSTSTLSSQVPDQDVQVWSVVGAGMETGTPDGAMGNTRRDWGPEVAAGAGHTGQRTGDKEAEEEEAAQGRGRGSESAFGVLSRWAWCLHLSLLPLRWCWSSLASLFFTACSALGTVRWLLRLVWITPLLPDTIVVVVPVRKMRWVLLMAVVGMGVYSLLPRPEGVGDEFAKGANMWQHNWRSVIIVVTLVGCGFLFKSWYVTSGGSAHAHSHTPQLPPKQKKLHQIL